MPSGILVMRADRRCDELFRRAADLGHRACAFEHEAVLALDLQPDHRRFHVVEREALVEKADEGAERGGRVVVLGLAEQQRGAALDVAQIDVVAECRADDAARARRDHRDFRLGIVPGRDRMQPDIGAEADRRHGLALGEDFGVGADADFEILRPDAALDQLGLDAGSLGRARLQPGEVMADQRGDVGADRVGLFGRAARLLLDDALEQRDDEGDARRLHRLEVDRRQQIGLLRIARGREAVLRDVGQRADRLAVGLRSHSRPDRPARKRRARSALRSR